MTIYDAKFTVYSTHEILEKLSNRLKEGCTVTEEEERLLERITEDIRHVISEKWEVGAF